MTVMLMLCMIVTFLAADKILRSVRSARELRAVRRPATALADPPEGIRLALNHTWMKMEKGVAVIGTDEFLARLLGAVESVILPNAGTIVAPAHADMAFAHGRRRIRLASPVAGRILEVNTDILQNPSLARRDPYGAGWLLRISPDPSRLAAPSSFAPGAPGEWLRAQMSMAKEFLAGAAPRASLATLQDGGEPVEGALLGCDAAAWTEFERRFTTIQEPGTH
ncbi:MAG TPA: glycine cleavage system protein H [Bacteroidota bacterium]|nr:glycine cleavage system protein H [Bacteroidota bacterium]